jgi:hypothetical protein
VAERFRLERGGVVLGVVTRGVWDGHQGSWRDWGWLEPSADFAAAGDLLARECRLQDEAVQLELADGDSSAPVAEAARLQAELMRPGVVLVSLSDGARWVLEELHTDAGRLYWR